MNVYDFDGTVYDGDSTLDFYRFCMKRHKKILLRLPGAALKALSYKSGRCTLTQFKEYFYRFLRDVPSIDREVKLFWRCSMKKIMPWYLKQRSENDVIISASPYFLLMIPCRRLGAKTLIASDVDRLTGKYSGENCKGEEKVRLFREKFPDAVIDEFYSDSGSDEPMARLARKAYMIRDGKIYKWERNLKK